MSGVERLSDERLDEFVRGLSDDAPEGLFLEVVGDAGDVGDDLLLLALEVREFRSGVESDASLEAAMLELDRVDAEVARWLVFDGALSEHPMDGQMEGRRAELRERRLRAVARVEAAGGRDPHPAFLREPTEAQRQGFARTDERMRLGELRRSESLPRILAERDVGSRFLP